MKISKARGVQGVMSPTFMFVNSQLNPLRNRVVLDLPGHYTGVFQNLQA